MVLGMSCEKFEERRVVLKNNNNNKVLKRVNVERKHGLIGREFGKFNRRLVIET